MNGRIPLTVLSLSLLLAACGQQQTPGSSAAQPTADATVRTRTEAPILGASNPHAIPGQYIVVFSEGAEQGGLSAQSLDGLSASGLIKSLSLDPQGITVQNIYSQAVQGFSARISAQNLQKLQADKRVKYIEQDSMQHAYGSQSGATWGLDRIDQTSLPLNRTYNYANTGSGVTAFIIDTGINTTHSEFGGRAYWGGNFSGDGNNYDCNGHGTHVSGTVGGTTYGVAKGVKLVAVKVLNCDGQGSSSGILNGMDWVLRNKPTGSAVANMSLGGDYSRSENDAIATMVNKGVLMVVAAGNENQNACNVSPASASSAFTVGATTSDDYRADFSNYGSCVDIFAPGQDITSSWIGSNYATNTISGTSMATPHVAGAAALVLAANPSYTPQQIASALVTNASVNKISDVAGSPNKLLYTGFLSGNTPTPTPPTPTPGTNVYTGSLSSGNWAFAPKATGASASGTITAKLTGDSGTDFDLYLEKWNGSAWVEVAYSENAGSTESISYNAAQGTYRLEVYSYSGSGKFRLETSGL